LLVGGDEDGDWEGCSEGGMGSKKKQVGGVRVPGLTGGQLDGYKGAWSNKKIGGGESRKKKTRGGGQLRSVVF